MNIIATLEKEEIERLGKKIPVFAPGDTVIVNVSVVEGERKRVQAYEGVVIAKRNRGLNSSFVVRKISSGEGVERTFQTYSPLIAGIEVKRKGDVRRAKLYYLRDRSGKSARIREKLAHVHREKQGKQQRPAASGRPTGSHAAARFLGADPAADRRSFGSAVASTGADLAPELASGTRFPRIFVSPPESPPIGYDESLALRSAGNSADRLRRGRARGAAATDPEILREDA